MEINKPSPYLALRFAEFRYYLFASFILTNAMLIQEVIIGYELYRLTHNPLLLGLAGLAEAVPYIVFSLFGGHYADKKDKKTMMFYSLLLMMAGSVVLALLGNHIELHGLPENEILAGIYSVIFMVGLARSFYSPAAQSLVPLLIPREAYTNAFTWSSAGWQMGSIVGPASAGFLYAALGFSNTLWLVVVLTVLVMVLQSQISRKPVSVVSKEQSFKESLREGFVYVFKTRIILYSISLDLFSVLFGGVVAILPVYAEDILHVGAEGLGILRAAASVGAVVMIFILVYIPIVKNAWRNMLLAVAGFGVATLVFAVSENFYLSVVALFFTGACDSISVVIRSTILKMLPPDAMRGRVSAVNGMFVSASNELGAFESGTAASLMGTVPSVVAGGIVTLLVVVFVFSKSKELFKVRLDQ